MGFLTAEEEEMLSDAYNTIKSIDSHLSEIHQKIVPQDDEQDTNDMLETPPSDEKSKLTEPIQELQESFSEINIPDYTAQIEQISKDLQFNIKVNMVIVLSIGIVAGLIVGKIMWGRIHAD